MELNSNESLLKNTLDSCIDMVQVFKAVRNKQNELVDFVWVLHNSASELIHGDVIGKSLLKTNRGVLSEGVFDALKRVANTGLSEQYELHYVHEQFNGWFIQSAVKLDDGVVTTTTNITERKKAEQQLLVVKERLQATLDSSLYFVQAFQAVRNGNGDIIDFTWILTNHIWNSHYGDVIGQSLLQRNPAVIETGLFDQFVQVTETGITIDQEIYYPYEQFHDQWFHQLVMKMGDGFVLNSQDITQKKLAEREIFRLKDEIAQNATDKYQNIFNSIDDGFAILELLIDESNVVNDFIYREVNAAFAQHAGITDVIGKSAKELFPNLEDYWLEGITEFLQTGEVVRIEGYHQDLGRWFTTHFARVGGKSSRLISVVFSDISERKAQEHLQAYLLRISDKLRLLSDGREIEGAVAAEALNYFQCDRCLYSTIEDCSVVIRQDAFVTGLTSMKGSYSLTEFKIFNKAIKNGRPVVVHNIRHSEIVDESLWSLLLSLDIQSFLDIPVVKSGELVGVFTLTACNPRIWTDMEIATAAETAERTWSAIERARGEEKLRKSRERLRVTMESATDYAIITMDINGKIEAWNKGAEFIFGYTEKEVVGQSLELIFTPEDRENNVLWEELRKAAENGRANDERWHFRRDGSRFYMSGVLSPIFDGQLTGFVKVARDMTAQKAADEQLRISEERSRVALQSADMAAWDWNVIDDTIRWNDQHFTILGLEPEDRLLDPGFFLRFIHPEDIQMVSKELMEAVNETGQYTAEAFRIIRADGVVRWMTGYGRTVSWENGKSSRMVGVMFDITARKELEQQKEHFIGIASHELKTPVTSIKAYTEVLQELFAETGDSRSAELMRKMDIQVDRLTQLIYMLLDTTRIAGGKMELQKSNFAMNELIMETADALRGLAGSQRIELQLDGEVIIYADRERIRQVLINLVGNAIKYAAGTERIIIRSGSTDKELIVSVQDFGIGIDEEEQQKVFEQFFRARDTTNISGLGLGLFISATIVREHLGRIWLNSRKGEGALFSFALPLTDT
jgi:PAS domain S-box-containing protein